MSAGTLLLNIVFLGACLAFIVFIVWMATLIARGFARSGRTQAPGIGDFPGVPEVLGDPVRGPDTGLYLGMTLAPSWQKRVTVGDYAYRADATIAGYPAGILVDRGPQTPIWIPRESVVAVRTERGIAGKVMTADGVLVIRWTLPSGVVVDTGIRADDKSVYPGWTGEYAELTEAAFAALDASEAGEDSTKKRKRR